MASLATIRQRVAAAIDTALSGAGWRESLSPIGVAEASDGENRAHKSYAVGMPASTAHTPERQRRAEGVLMETDLRVEWHYLLGAGQQVAGYDEALDAEASIVVAVSSVARSDGLHLVLVDLAREVDEEAWIHGSIHWRALHRVALA